MRIIFKIFDNVLRITIIFLLCFVWCRYFIPNFYFSIFVTAVLTFIFDFLLRFFENKKQGKKNLKFQDEKKIEEYINTFILSNKSITITFFYNLAKLKHNVTKKSNFIVVQNNSSRIALYPKFTFNEFNCDDLIQCYNSVKSSNVKKLVICTNKINNDVYKIAKNLPLTILLLDGENVYLKLLKPYNFFPPQTKNTIVTKYTFKDILNTALNKKRSKGYFLSALFILLSSIFVPYKIYYIIMASILLSLSLISLVNHKYNTIKNNEIFE